MVTMIMKQTEEMFERFIAGKAPLKRKWQMHLIEMDKQTSEGEESKFSAIVFKHYQHTIAIYNLDEKQFVWRWYEKKADQRGYFSIVDWMSISENLERLFKETDRRIVNGYKK